MSNDKRRSWYKNPAIIGGIIALLSIVVSIIIWQWPNPSPQPDFNMSVSPMQGTVQQDGITQTTVSVNGLHGYKYPVSLSNSEKYLI